MSQNKSSGERISACVGVLLRSHERLFGSYILELSHIAEAQMSDAVLRLLSRRCGDIPVMLCAEHREQLQRVEHMLPRDMFVK